MTTEPALSVQALFAAKEAAAAAKREEAALAAAERKAELAAFTERLMTYEITQDDKDRALGKIRRAFEAGEREVMLLHFPSAVCEDSGRRINNHLEGWQETLPGVLKNVYAWWDSELRPGGFTFSARIIDYPGGIPGDVGIFIGWPQMLT